MKLGKLSSLRAEVDKETGTNAWVHSANQIICLDNKEIQNKNKRPQWLLDEGGP